MSEMTMTRIFSHSAGSFLTLLIMSSAVHKILNFLHSHVWLLSFLQRAYVYTYLKVFPLTISKFSPFWKHHLCMLRDKGLVSFPCTFCWKVLSIVWFWQFLVKNQVTVAICEFVSGSFVPFICPFLCQYTIVFIFMILSHNLKSITLIPLILLFCSV